MNRHILTHGSLSPLPEYVELRAGRLTVMYESGFIRYIRNGPHEIVRVVNHYLRDRNWNTIPMHIHSEQIETTAQAFEITYIASIRHDDIDFSWKCTINGGSDETLVFAIDGEANSDFLKSRLGFTVLLPTEPLKGQTCRVTHPGGATEELLFPDVISPHQPFLDIQSMAWSPASGIQTSITFEGDTFEMEDQRNWMDASHKVYCTPLSLGFPLPIHKGDRIRQAVHVKVFGDLYEGHAAEEVVTFTLDHYKNPQLPRIGIPLSEVPMTKQQKARITDFGPDFVSVVIRDHDDIAAHIPAALSYDRPLEVILFAGTGNAEESARALGNYAARIDYVVVLVEGKRAADGAVVDAFVPWLRKYLPHAQVGSGTDAFFTELNRHRTPSSALDFLSFSVNPQTHASDLRTMTENLVAHRDVVESCRAFSSRDVRVGPVTLKMRWNPDATARESAAPDTLPANVDTRQLSLYAAGWTLGSIKYLAESGATSATYFEMSGWRGLMADVTQPWPSAFSVTDEQVYPVYIMLRMLLSLRKAVPVSLISSDTLRLDGMAFREETGIIVIVANYSREELSVRLPNGFDPSELAVVGADSIEGLLAGASGPAFGIFTRDTFSIPPFGFAAIRSTNKM